MTFLDTLRKNWETCEFVINKLDTFLSITVLSKKLDLQLIALGVHLRKYKFCFTPLGISTFTLLIPTHHTWQFFNISTIFSPYSLLQITKSETNDLVEPMQREYYKMQTYFVDSAEFDLI